MALLRTRTLELTLLLVLILPLQGVAAWSCGSFQAATAAAQQHCTQGSGATQHHNCGTSCCSAAIALTPLRWVAPRSTGPQAAIPVPGSKPSVILDRLDRPPRFVLA